jgi:hypothetical protein
VCFFERQLSALLIILSVSRQDTTKGLSNIINVRATKIEHVLFGVINDVLRRDKAIDNDRAVTRCPAINSLGAKGSEATDKILNLLFYKLKGQCLDGINK